MQYYHKGVRKYRENFGRLSASQVIVHTLENGLSLVQPAFVGLWLFVSHLTGFGVISTYAGAVAEGEAASVAMEGKRIGIAASQHIAAEGKHGMIQAQLTQQGGRHIGLIHDFVHFHRLLDGSAQP